MGLFGTIKNYALAIGAAAIGVLFIAVKVLSGQNRKLKHEIKVKEKIDKVEEAQAEQIKKNTEQERKAVDEKVSTLDRNRDSLNGL